MEAGSTTERSFRLFGKMIQVGREMEREVSIAQEAGTKEEEEEEEDTGEKSTTAAAAPPEKPEKRPAAKDDGIPCPRCRSGDTKFCYYNNYNANQPRHFCRSCQRYWTAGGAMRDVPVGAGRRRSKVLRAAAPPRGASQADAGNAKVLSFTVGNYPSHHAAPAGPACFWTGPCQSPPPPILPSCPPPPPLPPIWTVAFDGGSRTQKCYLSTGDGEERRGTTPETLRIDRHAEAAEIGMMGVVLFRPKKESKCQELGVRSFSHVMSSNPAAFSRSLNFQESI